MITNFAPRLYQQTILGTAAHKNTLVVLPTGLGKTAIAFLLAAQRLTQYPNSKILMLSPTKPLCEQHVQTFQNHLQIDPEKIVLFTGSVKPARREELWKSAQVIISTPQGLENDAINNRINLKEVSCLIFDEAHHATGDYAYVWLASQYEQLSSRSRILALTASPGSDMEKIKEVCQNLHIERVEVRTEKDADVKPYIQPMKFNWVEVDFPEEFKKVQKFLQDCRTSKLLEAKRLGHCNSGSMTKGELLRLQGQLQKQLSQGIRDFEMMRSVSLIAEALKVEHALELLESQGIRQCFEYCKNIQSQALTSKVKAVQNLCLDANFKSAIHVAESIINKEIKHPKLLKLQEILLDLLEQKPDSKTIIFTQFRDSADYIVKQLEAKHIKTHIFVGQAKKRGIGFSQKQQKEILDKFRQGQFNVLVATSVAEEGLDIPKVDKVLFYEPVPSAIRAIQRRGRTGRLEEGIVTILITKGTRDVAYRWSAHHKEKRMYRNLEKLRTQFSFLKEQARTTTLERFIPKEQVVTILADHREKDNKIVKELIDLGVSVKTGQLESADYVVSGKVGVELKKIPDFVASIIDGRLLDQVKDLKRSFEKSVLIVEGEEDIYAIRKVHANAIRGMLSSITLGFGVPILYTKNPKDTAALLAVMAKREQDKDSHYSYHAEKPKSLKEQQEFIISSFPGIGPNMAKKLLESFGSVRGVVSASKEKLVAIEGVGEKTASRIVEMSTKEYSHK